MADMASLYGSNGDNMRDLGQQRNRWSASQGATTVTPQTGGGLFQSPSFNDASANPPSNTPQFHPSVQMNDLYAIAPNANPLAGHNQRPSLDAQINNSYTTASGAYGGQQMVGQHAISSGSNPFASHIQHQLFPDVQASPFGSDLGANPFAAHTPQTSSSDAQVGNQDQCAMSSGADYGTQIDNPYAFGNPFAAQTQETYSHDTIVGSNDQYAIESGGNGGMQMDNLFAMDQGTNQIQQISNNFPDARMDDQYTAFSGENPNVGLNQQRGPYMQTDDQYAIDSGSNPFSSCNNASSEGYSRKQSSASSEVRIKREHSDDDYFPGNLPIEDEFDEETSKQPGKKRKVNKNGRTRKVREPRGHLRRWDENDVTRALMGIVWACGENGVVIPFGQAAKIVDQDCTSGALQQAILKMHDKLNKDGAQLPRIKMNWPKKPNTGGKSVVRDNGKVPRKKPTCTQATQCNIVSLPTLPHDNVTPGNSAVQGDFVLGLHNTTNIQVQHAQLPHRPAMSQVPTVSTSTQADAPSGLQSDLPSTRSPYEAQEPQGLPITNSPFGQSSSVRVKHDSDDEMLSSPRQIPDMAPSTPVQPRRSPVCPSAPRPLTAARRPQYHLSTGATTLNQRFPLNAASSPLPNFAQQRATGHTQQQGQNRPTNLLNRRLQQGRANNTQLSPLAAFNADFEQRIASGLAQRPSSSNMRPDTSSMPRNAAFSTDATLTPSPMNGRFQADGNPQGVSDFADFQSMFSTDETSRPSGNASSTNEQPTEFGAFTVPRKDSAVFSGTQSTSSSQGSAGSADNPYQVAHQLFQRSQNVPTERSSTATPSRAMRAYHSRQQPRQQLSLGLDTVSNPFGGTFGDALGGPFSPARIPGGVFEDPFGQPTTTDASMNFGDL